MKKAFNQAVEEFFDQLLLNEKAVTAESGKIVDFSFKDLDAKIFANVSTNDDNMKDFQMFCNPKVIF